MAAIYRRGKTWWGRIRREGKEIRQSLQTTDRREAQRIFARWVAEVEHVAKGGRPNRSFEELVEHFMANHMPTLRPASQRRYAVSLQHLLKEFANEPIERITSARLADFEAKRRRESARPPTIRRDLFCLSSIFSCAIEWEWIEANPVSSYLRRRAKRGLKEAAPRTRWVTEDEERRLLAAASPEVRNAIAFAIDTGLRREEQFSLKHQQISLAREELKLDTNTKTARSRTVPLLPRALALLGTLPRHIHTPWVFRHRDGERYLQMNKGLKAAARRAGIEDVRWHDLRRTCGCRLLQVHGLSMEQVRDWLGHSSVITTEKIYAFLTVDDLHRAVGTGTKTGTTESADQ
jgi:integrase